MRRLATAALAALALSAPTAARASWFSEITGIDIDIPNGTVRIAPPKPQAIPQMLQHLPQDAAQALLNPAGNALAVAIRVSRNTAGANAQPIPPAIRAQLAPFFPPQILDRARYNTSKASLSLPAAINAINEGNSVTLDDLIVFSDGAAASDPLMWAHELTHVMQYQNMGVEAFANVYTLTGGSDLERQARDMANRIAVALQNNAQPLNVTLASGAFTQPLTVTQMQQQAQAYYPAANCTQWQASPGGALVRNLCPVPIMVTSFGIAGPYGTVAMPCNFNCVVPPGYTVPFGPAPGPVVGFTFVY